MTPADKLRAPNTHSIQELLPDPEQKKGTKVRKKVQKGKKSVPEVPADIRSTLSRDIFFRFMEYFSRDKGKKSINSSETSSVSFAEDVKA